MHQTLTLGAVGRIATRTIVLIVALIAMLIVTTALDLTAPARAGQFRGQAGSHVTSQTASQPLKAVVIVGPTHGQTDQYLEWGETIAQVAEDGGMDVARIFYPNALWTRVVEETTGANLVVYLGHGNGWPSPYAPYQENTKDGFGLNFPDPSKRGEGDVKYYGGNKVREELHLAANAIVILNHACYSAGQGEPGMATPSRSVAVQRVDNFAAGFLAVGARTVFGIYHGPAEDIIESFLTEHDTMDGVFRNRYNPWNNGVVAPFYGWVGWDPTYHDSVRTPGARILLDPDPDEGYARSVAGDLEMTTDEWSGSADPSDVTDPEVTSLEGVPSADTIPADVDSPPVFTPNGDGLSDNLSIDTTVSEDSYLSFEIRDSSDAVVRSFEAWSDAGDGSNTWNGKNDANGWVPEGRYDIYVTPRDLAGNVGDPVSTRVKVLKAMKSPTGAPSFLYAKDGDSLRQSSALSVTITEDATLDWKIVDSSDSVVRTFMDQQSVSAGLQTRTWDARDAAGAYVPDGMYWQVLTATTDAGTYSHRLGIRVMAFKVTAPKWTGPAGTKVTFTVTSAEPLSGYASIWVYQPGLAKYYAPPVRSSSTKFKFTVTFKSGGTPGQVKIKISGNDTAGGSQSQLVWFTLQ